ncbi:MAG: prepilin-type N-terminal cleavage/methylation domain-containing protein [Parcubacteria group bacterium]
MTTQHKNLNDGLTLVEVMIATSIILVFLLALFGIHNMYLKTAFSGAKAVKAAYLAEESLEVMRFMRDSSWDENILPLALETNYGLVFNAGVWQTTTTDIWMDNLFERTVLLSAVYRDISGDVVSSGGTLDPDTRMVTVTVSWENGTGTTTKSISTYITNLFDD